MKIVLEKDDISKICKEHLERMFPNTNIVGEVEYSSYTIKAEYNLSQIVKPKEE